MDEPSDLKQATLKGSANVLIRSVLDGTSGRAGENYCPSLVRSLAQTFGTRWAFIGELTYGGDSIRTLSFWQDGELLENFDYDLKGTPCEINLEKGFCHFSKNLQQEFPDDHSLIRLGVEAYMGVTLTDSRNRALGILSIMDTAPFSDKDQQNWMLVLEIFAARTAVELERQHAEEGLRSIIKRTVGITGQDCFDAVVTEVCRWLGADLAMVCVIIEDNIVDVLSMRFDGRIKDSEGFLLENTPYKKVTVEGYYTYSENLHELFPDTRDVQDLKAEAYSGIAVRNRSGDVIGVLCAMFRRKIKEGPFWREIMGILAAKGAAEIECSQSDKERLKLEEQLLQSQKMAAVGRLADEIAHDLNNILTSINGYSEMILITLPLDSPINPDIKEILKASERAGDLTQQLQAFSRK